MLVSAVTRGVPEYRIAVADAEREEAEENEFRDRHSASGDEHEEGGVGRSDARFMFAVCVLVSLGSGGSALAAFEVCKRTYSLTLGCTTRNGAPVFIRC